MAETGKEARPPLLRADAALFLDFDGTLAAYASHPDGVTIEAGLPALLARLRGAPHGARGRPRAHAHGAPYPPRSPPRHGPGPARRRNGRRPPPDPSRRD